MSTITNMSLVSSVLTPEILEAKTEFEMRAITRLVIALLQRAPTAFLNEELPAFNCNPGDHGCQNRTLILPEFAQSSALLGEAKLLQNVSFYLSKKLRLCTGNSMKEAPSAFFQREIAPLKISKEMGYLLLSYLLTITKVKDKEDEETGFVFTKLCHNRIAALSKNMVKYFPPKVLIHFLSTSSARVAESSFAMLRKIVAPFKENHSLMVRMLAEDQLRRVQFKEGFPSKPFAILFFQMQGLLEHLKQTGGIVAIEEISDPTKRFFLKGSEQGFVSLKPEEVKKGVPLTLFKCGLGKEMDMEKLGQKIAEIGFEKIILVLAAQEKPYDRATSTIDDVKDPVARALIEDFAKKAKSLELEKNHDPFLNPRHLLCELKK